MKRIVILILISVSFSACSEQDGFKIIEDARINYKLGDLDQALYLLDQASSADYGTCGNSYLEAYVKIADLKAEIYFDKKDYQRVRAVLNESNVYGGYIDSLRIQSYKLELGADSLSNMIDASIPNVIFKLDKYALNGIVLIPLINGVDTMKFLVDLYIDRIEEMKNPSYTDEWITDFKLSKNYEMIKKVHITKQSK